MNQSGDDQSGLFERECVTTIAALKTINPDVKIITSSGMASDGGMAKARNAGVRYFIPKPYTAATVLNTLHEVLNGKQ